ncbi:MAG TPA: DUF2914 domain-containing protein [Candidatus Paceibacterota bacterium]
MHTIKIFFHKYEATLSALTLFLGFIFDYFTLNRIDFFWDNFFIVLYLLCSGIGIVIINLYESGKLPKEIFENVYTFLPFLIQFAFGGLFSAFVVFYSKSASLFTSGAFVLILLALLVGNEFFKERYSKLVFQVGIYFVSVFSFSIFFIPVLTKKMGAGTFLLSGLVSLGLISVLIFIIYRFTPERYQGNARFLAVTVLGLYIFINILYFANIIPPIPLSLKAGDVYHSVEKKSSGQYVAVGEVDTWREKFGGVQSVHLRAGEPVYVFSSVFAPTELQIDIVHDWQYLNLEGKWVSATKITFPIRGGRNEGYRGFSKKENIFPGHWRVDVATTRGQVIGRVRFDIEITDTPILLKQETL